MLQSFQLFHTYVTNIFFGIYKSRSGIAHVAMEPHLPQLHVLAHRKQRGRERFPHVVWWHGPHVGAQNVYFEIKINSINYLYSQPAPTCLSIILCATDRLLPINKVLP
jgi:hypothetical protein